MKKLTYVDIDNMFFNLKQKTLFLRLVNSGQSNLSDKQDVLVKEAFDLAFVLLKYAFEKQKMDLFNRVYDSAREIVPGSHIKNVMKYPDMYKTMAAAKIDFFDEANRMYSMLIQRFRRPVHLR